MPRAKACRDGPPPVRLVKYWDFCHLAGGRSMDCLLRPGSDFPRPYTLRFGGVRWRESDVLAALGCTRQALVEAFDGETPGPHGDP
jgi:predicted DNA-binding transcriptional regulator AlpA